MKKGGGSRKFPGDVPKEQLRRARSKRTITLHFDTSIRDDKQRERIVLSRLKERKEDLRDLLGRTARKWLDENIDEVSVVSVTDRNL